MTGLALHGLHKKHTGPEEKLVLQDLTTNFHMINSLEDCKEQTPESPITEHGLRVVFDAAACAAGIKLLALLTVFKGIDVEINLSSGL